VLKDTRHLILFHLRRMQASQSLVYYRLIALWVLCEALLGGIIHGLRLPVSGLIVGSAAVICITLIAWKVPYKGAILKATVIVAIFKMMLSPQAPPPAYIAVFFQGLTGELFFWNRKNFKVACYGFAIVALAESGLQRILVLTILYGNDLWTAINSFMNKLTGQKTWTNYSFWFITLYTSIHLVTGVVLGWWLSLLPGRMQKWKYKYLVDIPPGQETGGLAKPVKRSKGRLLLFIIWIALFALYIQSTYKIGPALLPPGITIRIIVRSLIIVLSWIFIVSPLLKYFLQRWLSRKKKHAEPEIAKVLALLPSTQQLVVHCWKLTAGLRGWNRWIGTAKRVLVSAIAAGKSTVFIYTGYVQTGKTTQLLKWIQGRSDIYGILTPIIDGKRKFMDAGTGQIFEMESSEGEQRVLPIGKYSFSRAGFEKATWIIENAMNKEGWVVIDEIGPLELEGKGFAPVLKKLLAMGRPGVVLVIRDKDEVAKRVIQEFGIEEYKIIRSINELNV
jgi:nucleoside-triphosphatase THEP1